MALKARPYILTIAGLDPSSGAGLTADIKTFEQIGCYGLAVCSANTIQNDITLEMCDWISPEIMKNQIDLLFNRFEIDFVKIGVIENWEVLQQITSHLIFKNPNIKIILDPVLKSSSNFSFHSSNDQLFKQLLSTVYLVTPNLPEIESLFSDLTPHLTIDMISTQTNLLLKGGHRINQKGIDELYDLKGQQILIEPISGSYSEKHGSGCILSSAITSYLALGYSLLEACIKGKRYTEKVLGSNTSLLGYHA
jgi:hydroxymethylpyrimidine/phosphomethylpyrimidine kinase